MNTPETINQILLGGLLGIIGQGLRIIVGMIKLQTTNAEKKLNGLPETEFSLRRLLLSLFIGFIAGSLCAIIKGAAPADQTRAYMLAIVAAGYSGTDFIEGAMKPLTK